MQDQSLQIIGALALFIGFGGFVAVGGWVWQLSKNLAEQRAETKAAQKRADEALALAVETKDHLAAFELEAARRFITDEMLAKVEERVIAAIDRLANRLDRAFEARTRTRKPSEE